MAQAGLTPVGVEICELTEDDSYRAALRLLTAPLRPTAIFAVSDIAAIGALSALEDLGLRCPGDVSIVGYDNTSIGRIRPIGLTTIDIGSSEMGRLAADRMAARLNDPTMEAGVLVTMKPQLVARRSTGPS